MPEASRQKTKKLQSQAIRGEKHARLLQGSKKQWHQGKGTHSISNPDKIKAAWRRWFQKNRPISTTDHLILGQSISCGFPTVKRDYQHLSFLLISKPHFQASHSLPNPCKYESHLGFNSVGWSVCANRCSACVHLSCPRSFFRR